MTLSEVRSYLDGVNGKEIELGLDSVTALMEALDWPDKELKIIHVTGTNGKGSVCEMISQILQKAHYTVGTFNSPYFEVHNECIRINNEMISDENLLKLMNEMEPVIKTLEEQGIKLSGFEILAVLALVYFKEMEVDFVILEVGLGGRLDATNVIKKSTLTILTKIAIDHQNYLGHSLEEIAYEKAGIIKERGIVLMPTQDEAVNKVIQSQCREKKALLKTASYLDISSIEMNEEGIQFIYKEESYHLSMLGKYQAYNASLAIEAVKILKQYERIQISAQQIKEGLVAAYWVGRFEKVSDKPLCFIDGAHNLDGIKALTQTLEGLPKRKNIAIIGMLRDKEVDEMLKVIMPYIDACIVTKPLNSRAEEVEILAKKAKGYINEVYPRERIEEAYQMALQLANQQEAVQIIGFGSLYMIGKLRAIIKGEQCSKYNKQS